MMVERVEGEGGRRVVGWGKRTAHGSSDHLKAKIV